MLKNKRNIFLMILMITTAIITACFYFNQNIILGKHTNLDVTMKEYEIKDQDIEKAYNTQSKMLAEKSLITQILANSTIKKYPEKDVEEYKTNMRNSYNKMAKNMDMTFEELLTYMEMTEKEFEKDLDEEANYVVSKKMIVNKIAKRYFIKVSEKEYEEFLKKIEEDSLSQLNYMKQELEDTEELNDEELRYAALENEVMKWLWKKNDIKVEKVKIK